MDRRAKVLDFGDDEATEYAILSHRWIGQEVDHDEIVDLAKMAVEERDEIRRRGGYRKILDSCEQARKGDPPTVTKRLIICRCPEETA